MLERKCVECGQDDIDMEFTWWYGAYKGVKRQGGTPLCPIHAAEWKRKVVKANRMKNRI
jgi:hypothetical protein